MPYDRKSVRTYVYTPEEGESYIPVYARDAGKGQEFSAIQSLCHMHAVASGWWHEPTTNLPKELNFGERIALMHSELSEALEGFRKQKMCDKPGLEDMTMVEEEFADTIIRIFDTAEAMNMDLARAIMRKLEYNSKREDHKIESRQAEGGKAF